MNTTNTDISTRALLVWLTISTWTARKYDRKVSDDVNRSFHADTTAGRYNKFLMAGDATTYRALVTLAGTIRAEHYQKTLAWADEGGRVLPSDQFSDYTDWYRGRMREFDAARHAFVCDYPMLRQMAQAKLNGLYRDSDYPSETAIASKFQLDVSYAPIPMASDIRVGLADDQLAAIEASVTARVQSATETAMRDAWTRLYTVTSRIAERLSVPDAIFRDSLIENAREMTDALKSLNVTRDPRLDEMALKVQHVVYAFEPEDIRESEIVRGDVARQAQTILDQMRAVYGQPLSATE